jgi:iron(III) transport system permease protein
MELLQPAMHPPVPGRLRWRRLFRADVLVVLVVVVVVGYMALVPLGYLVRGAFFDHGHLTLGAFRDAYAAVGLGTMTVNSLRFAFGSTALAVVLGTALAFLVVRTDLPLRRLTFVLGVVPLIVPGLLYTIAWMLLAGPRAGALNELPVPGHLNVFSMGGMMFVEGLHLAPLVFLLMAAAFRSMDPSLEESAIMSGARPLTVFFRITLPLMRPALYAAILVMVVRSLEAFEVPVLLGIPSGIWVFTSRIWRALDTFPIRLGQAGAYALSLVVLTSIGVALYSRLTRRVKRYETVTARGFRPRRIPLGRWRLPATALVLGYMAVAVALPVLILLYASLQPIYSVPSVHRLSHTTLANYQSVLSDADALHATGNSLLLGVGTATAVMLAMAVVSWVIVRTRLPGRWLIDSLASLPLVIPGLVVGLALLVVYLELPLPVYGTLWILFLAYFTRFMPYGMRYATASMRQLSGELESAARTSGASWWQTFRRVILPLVLPGLLAGWIYVLIVSVRELSSSVVLASPGTQVLAVQLFQEYQDGKFSELAALGILMMLMLVVMVALAYRLGARVGVWES